MFKKFHELIKFELQFKNVTPNLRQLFPRPDILKSN